MLQFLVFAGVGATATSIHYGILITGVRLLNADPLIASTLGAACGAVVSYCLNYHFTFHSRSTHLRAVTRFALAVLVGTGVNYFILAMLLELSELHYFVAQLFTTAIVLLANFAAARWWIFNQPR